MTYPFAIEFLAKGRPVAFSRDTAVRSVMRQKATGKRRGAMNDDTKTWRQAIVVEFRAAVAASPHRAIVTIDGSYTGLLGLYVEIYGGRADILNVCKEVEDALIGVAFDDDKRIVSYGLIAPHRRLNKRTGGLVFAEDEEQTGVVVNLLYYGDTEWVSHDPVAEIVRNKV